MTSVAQDNTTILKTEPKPSLPLAPSAELGSPCMVKDMSNCAGKAVSGSSTLAKPTCPISNDMAESWENIKQDAPPEDEDNVCKKSGAAENFVNPPIVYPPQLPVVSAQSEFATRHNVVPSASYASNELPDDAAQTMAGRPLQMLPNPVSTADKTKMRPKTADLRLYRPKSVKSYREIFNISDGENYLYDQSFLLQPFNRVAYVNQSSANKEDFYHYAWLLAQSEENWYAIPSATTLARMRTSGLEKRKPIVNPRPASMTIPLIVANDALYLETDGEESVERVCWGECNLLHPDDPPKFKTKIKENVESESSSDDDDIILTSTPEEDSARYKLSGEVWRCRKCYQRNLKLQNDIGWVYYTVIRTDALVSGKGQGGNGVGMFMFRKSSSRERAASCAFYDAGALGFSTVFCCAIRADVQLMGWKGKVESVINCVHRVMAPVEKDVLRVYL